nr:hypothetical protein [Tessaracoccus coleopterorum]
MRHVHYAITPDMRDRWVRHMMAAVDTLDLDAGQDDTMREYLVRAADFMVNAD